MTSCSRSARPATARVGHWLVVNCFSRLASDLVIRPDGLRHQESEASLKPDFRYSALIGKPASAPRPKPMICSSLHRFFLSNLRLLKHWLPNQRVTQNRADVAFGLSR